MTSTDHLTRLPTSLQQAGIDHDCFKSDTIEFREVAPASILKLHSLADLGELSLAVKRAGIDLPLRVNESKGQDPAALCLRPKEWLLFSEDPDTGRLLERLLPAVDRAETALLNLSDGLATFRLSGAGAPWLLSKLSGLDFLAHGTAGQHCARTRMARAAAIVHYHRPGSDAANFVFDLILDRSIAKYMWELLTASAGHADDLVKSCDKL
jgi:heterotetrameric sarcosine oxidase gamma subunit